MNKSVFQFSTSSSPLLADDGGQTVPSAAAGRQEAGVAGSGLDDSDFILIGVATNPKRLRARGNALGSCCMAVQDPVAFLRSLACFSCHDWINNTASTKQSAAELLHVVQIGDDLG